MSAKPYLVALLLLGSATLGWANDYGRFDGSIKTEWLDADKNPRLMRLLDDFIYEDGEGKRWVARKGAVVDGASIPRAFWPVIGGPFDGVYRNASVVHDYYCATRSEPWEAVHRMFYYAMRAAGVEEVTAKIMFYAVWNFGPRWQAVKTRDGAATIATVRSWTPPDDPERRDAETQWIRQANPELADIEALSALRQQ